MTRASSRFDLLKSALPYHTVMSHITRNLILIQIFFELFKIILSVYFFLVFVTSSKDLVATELLEVFRYLINHTVVARNLSRKDGRLVVLVLPLQDILKARLKNLSIWLIILAWSLNRIWPLGSHFILSLSCRIKAWSSTATLVESIYVDKLIFDVLIRVRVGLNLTVRGIVLNLLFN